MSFNQWAATRPKVEGRFRYALEDIWNALIGSGKKPNEVARLLDGLFS